MKRENNLITDKINLSSETHLSQTYKMKAINHIKVLSFFIVALFVFQSCDGVSSNNVIRGDGNIMEESFDVSAFNSIDLKGMFNVILTKSDVEKVIFEADSNIHECITVEVKGNTLMVYTDRKSIYKPNKMDLYIYYVDIADITSGGASKITSTNSMIADKLELDLSGATSMELELEVNELITNASGASDLVFYGNANTHEIILSGAGSLKAESFYTKTTTINLSGAGSAYLHADENLDASISGVGSVHYAGNPVNTKFSKSGLGSIKSIN